jgi:hypothetical protein
LRAQSQNRCLLLTWVQLVRPADERSLQREAVRQGVSFSLVDPDDRTKECAASRERYTATVPSFVSRVSRAGPRQFVWTPSQLAVQPGTEAA